MNNIEDLVGRIMDYTRLGHKPEKMVRKIVHEWMHTYTNDVVEVVYKEAPSLFHKHIAYSKGQANKEEALNVAIMTTIEAIKADEHLSVALRKGRSAAAKYNNVHNKIVNEY
jgi:hypothetical protein